MNEELRNKFYNKVALFEGFRSRPYRCPAGVLTIGYGHTANVKREDVVTIAQAKQLLKDDFKLIFQQLSSISDKIILKEHELWAIADFIFNLGFAKFKKSSVYRYLIEYSRACDDPIHYNPDKLRTLVVGAIAKYDKYHSPDGRIHVSSGLAARRQFEIRLFTDKKIY